MTKLTQQEIEKEREDFECWFEKYYGANISELYSSEVNQYNDYFADNVKHAPKFAWSAFLARAELAKGE